MFQLLTLQEELVPGTVYGIPPDVSEKLARRYVGESVRLNQLHLPQASVARNARLCANVESSSVEGIHKLTLPAFCLLLKNSFGKLYGRFSMLAGRT
jgi:hypothetical protein